MKRDIAEMRENYKAGKLLESDVDNDPFRQFKVWLDEAIKSEIPEPNAMNLATVSAIRRPSSRIVLLKEVTIEGFIFYTNYNSKKGKEMDVNPFAALNFLWKELERQVRIEGSVEKISREKSEQYFHSRPFESQLGALSSHQSQKAPDRSQLENRFRNLKKEYQDQGKAPMPEHWGGYLLRPDYFEFWQGRESRLHDRLAYQFKEDSWKIFRLEP
ncbi:pyridoxamine 5'-phosphate oxidase [Portibacter marinus]|uniref:pyridoxamine 5'-phosphate oxidase n=1 Tax=Portibacter marinus TaxID=2898660 RepID=UPI001F48A247|nr:pyridoxamine 5'-phosphate oxidase [Portibacter marinus]